MVKAIDELTAAHAEMATAIAKRSLAIDAYNAACANLWKATGSEATPPSLRDSLHFPPTDEVR
jgi:hypothetical protein